MSFYILCCFYIVLMPSMVYVKRLLKCAIKLLCLITPKIHPASDNTTFTQ